MTQIKNNKTKIILGEKRAFIKIMMSQIYISLISLHFNQDESDKRAGILRFKSVLSNTDSRYTCTNYKKMESMQCLM